MGDKERALDYMMENGSITSWDAYEAFGCTRLSSVIHRLRKDGFPIVTETVYGKDRFGEPMNYAKYRMEERR